MKKSNFRSDFAETILTILFVIPVFSIFTGHWIGYLVGFSWTFVITGLMISISLKNTKLKEKIERLEKKKAKQKELMSDG